MAEEKKLKYWKVISKGTYLSLMGSPEAKKLIQKYGEQVRAEKLHKKKLAQQEKQHTD